MLKKFFTIILAVLSNIVFAQTYLISTGGTVNTCAGDFYDSGDTGGAYGNNENFTMTFCSNNAVNTHIKVYFWDFDIDPSDTLYIYDGANTGAPLIGAYNDANSLFLYMIKATLTNPSGCLTFKFKSDGATNSAGWKAEISCIPLCQQVISTMSSSTNPPAVYDTNDSCYYIDICFGNSISFVGSGSYPENDMVYHQDDGTSTFDWNFGDGTFGTGQNVEHLYDLVRGYDVTLTVTDVNGCVSTNFIALRVRISENPFGDINPLPDICSGTNLDINVGYDPNSSIVVDPVGSHQSASQGFDSTMFVPDGPNCPEQCYNTDVEFNAFAPGQTITSVDDILSICVNMEHSFIGDLEFTIICPNGQSVVLKEYISSGRGYLGEPYGGDSHGTYDDGCDPADNPSGTGWNYCWSEIYPTIGTINDHSSEHTLVATDTVNNTGYYDPNAGFSGLIGCPLNGVWTIEICDYWSIDNGYIFSWDLNLDPNLLPTGWGYDIPIDQIDWDGPFITDQQDSIITVSPDYGGTFAYTVNLTDAFGCSYDTTIYLNVLQTPDVNLGTDTVICGGDIITLDAGAGYDTYYWSTGSSNQSIPVNTSGIYSVTATNTNGIISCIDSDSKTISIIPMPLLDLGPDICSPIPYTLDAGNPGFNYLWSTGATTQTIDVTLTGNYSVLVTDVIGSPCYERDTVYIRILPEPVINLGDTATICDYLPYALNATTELDPFYVNNYDYYWIHTLNGQVCAPSGQTSKTIALDNLEVGTHQITVYVIGCDTVFDTFSLNVKICPLTIPNVFTPNGDGVNDFFYIDGLEFYPNSTLIIYNRWGQKVLEDTNYQNNWDGGKNSDGVYYWILKLVDRRGTEEHGTITIVGKQ